MRILPPILVLIFVAAMVLLRSYLPDLVVFPPPYNWIGIVPMLIGFAISATGARHFGRVKTNIRTFNEPTLLVTDGLFAWSRNPMYLGFSVFLTGLAIALGTLTPLLLAAAFVVITDRWYIAFEERAMTRKFGDAYVAYTQRTRRWL